MPSDQPILVFLPASGDDDQATGLAKKNAIDAAVTAAYGDTKAIQWLTLLVAEKGHKETGEYVSNGTQQALADHPVGFTAELTFPEHVDTTPVAQAQLFDCPKALLTHLGWTEAAAALQD